MTTSSPVSGPTMGRRERGFVLAACAVAVATAVGSTSTGPRSRCPSTSPPSPKCSSTNQGAAEARAIQQIERYCTSSWRNAGVRRQDWDDCTQQALVELLSTSSPSDLVLAIEEPESEARRELNRAVWRLVQRCRRRVPEVAFVDAYAPAREVSTTEQEWQAIDLAASDCLTARQQQIVRLSREGWRVAEIAEKLDTTPERVSDEKYKALAKLRAKVGDAATTI